MTLPPPPGSVVAFWNGNALEFAVSGGEEKQRVRLVLPGGAEERVQAARIACEVGPPGPVPSKDLEARRAAGERAAAARDRVERLAAGVDVPLVWELAREAGAGPPDETDLADLALGSTSGEARSALILALVADGVRFVRRGTGWEPRSPAAVEELLHQRRRSAEREAERKAIASAFAEAAAGRPEAVLELSGARRYLQALEELALKDLAADDISRDLAVEAIGWAGVRCDRAHEGAFRLLRHVGRFGSDDENLAITRYGLRTTFPPAVEAVARAAAGRGFLRDGRADLTGVEVVTVDGPQTREIDDGLSLETLGGGRVRLGIHVADPAVFVEPGDAVDEEALARATSHYLPERRLPMLPQVLSEGAASLVDGEERPALSFLVELGPEGEVIEFEALRSTVRSRARLTYDLAAARIRERTGPFTRLLLELAEVADQLRRVRTASGAVLFETPEVEVRVTPEGRIVLERSEGRSIAHLLVSEAMILAGALAARLGTERGVPLIYRRQPPPAGPMPDVAAATDPLIAGRRIRMALRRGEAGLQPGPHFALGLPAYAQVTSPLRRYQDLATHRQLAAVLGGEPLPYDGEALQRIAAITEQAEGEGRRAERASERYWLLKYLELRTGEVVEAIVVETRPRAVVLLTETLLEEPVPSLAGGAEGDRVPLRVARVNPRADILTLRPA
jgi:exoribonuclease II